MNKKPPNLTARLGGFLFCAMKAFLKITEFIEFGYNLAILMCYNKSKRGGVSE
jgi:hypothetical protein